MYQHSSQLSLDAAAVVFSVDCSRAIMATALLSASLQSVAAHEVSVKSRLPSSPAHESLCTSSHRSTYIIFCNEDAESSEGWPKEREYRSGTGNQAANQGISSNPCMYLQQQCSSNPFNNNVLPTPFFILQLKKRIKSRSAASSCSSSFPTQLINDGKVSCFVHNNCLLSGADGRTGP